MRLCTFCAMAAYAGRVLLETIVTSDCPPAASVVVM
jgi:hypothetical protein